jgi:hypothetical protein
MMKAYAFLNPSNPIAVRNAVRTYQVKPTKVGINEIHVTAVFCLVPVHSSENAKVVILPHTPCHFELPTFFSNHCSSDLTVLSTNICSVEVTSSAKLLISTPQHPTQ